MTRDAKSLLLHGAVLLAGIAAPLVFPNYTFQLAVLWVMILFALTWDILGGQMGYNSLGNILFFGAGMYICAVVQIGLYYDVGEYTSAFGAVKVEFTTEQYFIGLALGLVAAALLSMVLAVIFGWIVFGLRGPYFAIGTLGVALAAPDERAYLYYFLCMAAAVSTFAFLKWLYSTRFKLALNAIRDDEEKAESMGLHTVRHKTVAWTVAAFFLGISGGIFGNMIGFIEPLEVAFPTVTFGIFMVLMVLLGGKGTLWGPVIGATLFHVIKEVTWTHLLGWQWVALGLLIIINVVYFQQGILGWAQDKWPEKFGIAVDPEPVGDEDRREAAE
jgi:branched-chain amino acid transport system permease protein